MQQQKGDIITLGYWAIRGLAQVSRFLLEYTGQQYTEKLYTEQEQWYGKDDQELFKKGLFWYNLPYVIDGEFLVSESEAVEIYIINKSQFANQLLGIDIKEKAQVNMLIGVINDLKRPLVDLCYDDSFDSQRKSHYESNVKPFLQQLNEFIGNKKFLLGDQIKYCDFILYETLQWVKGVYTEDFKQFDKLNAFNSNFENISQIKNYMKSNRYIKAPFTSPKYGKWTGLETK